MQTLFVSMSFFLFLMAWVTMALIFREAFPLLDQEDQPSFRRWISQKMRKRTRAINNLWGEHGRSFPRSRKRLLFAVLLIASATSLLAYPLWLVYGAGNTR